MPTITDARATLDIGKLKLPQEPRIRELQVDEYVDADGDDALRVRIFLDEEVDAGGIPGKTILEIKDRIRTQLKNAGFELFCYISFVKASELNLT